MNFLLGITAVQGLHSCPNQMGILERNVTDTKRHLIVLDFAILALSTHFWHSVWTALETQTMVPLWAPPTISIVWHEFQVWCVPGVNWERYMNKKSYPKQSKLAHIEIKSVNYKQWPAGGIKKLIYITQCGNLNAITGVRANPCYKLWDLTKWEGSKKGMRERMSVCEVLAGTVSPMTGSAGLFGAKSHEAWKSNTTASGGPGNFSIPKHRRLCLC